MHYLYIIVVCVKFQPNIIIHLTLSPVEVEKYCALETPDNELEKRFKEESLRLRAAAQPPTNNVFTHIHQEEFVAKYEVGPWTLGGKCCMLDHLFYFKPNAQWSGIETIMSSCILVTFRSYGFRFIPDYYHIINDK